MFHFKNKIKNARKEREKKNYDLTYDNVAIPEVHKAASDATTHTAEEQNSSEVEHASSVSFDNVAIPETNFQRELTSIKMNFLPKQPVLSGTSDDSECPVRQAVFVFLIYRCPSIIHNLIQICSL